MGTFTGDTADEVWLAICRAVQRRRTGWVEGRGGRVLDLGQATIRVRDPRQRWVVSREPAMNPAFAIAEAFWILAGDQDAALPTFFNPALPRFAGHGPAYRGAYGYRLRRHFGLDQLDRAYQALAANPSTRQVVVQLWDPTVDLARGDGEPQHEDIPCNVCGFLKVRRGRLDWTQVMRSTDVFLGLPHNFVQFTVLQEVVAGWLGVEPGSFTVFTDSLHVYERDMPYIRAARHVPHQGCEDGLGLHKSESEQVLGAMFAALKAMVDPALTRETLRSLASADDLPGAYHNLLLIAAADAARRRSWADLARHFAAQCTSPLLVILWELWWDRQQARESRIASAVGLG